MRRFITEILGLLSPKELTGTADIDISEAVYTGYVEILSIVPKAGGNLRNVCIDLDFNKATTGCDEVATASDTINAAVFMKTDGTNYRHVMSMTQITATGDASHKTAGARFQVGSIGVGADCSVRVMLSAERADCEIPYRITYEGMRAPTVTPVAAG